MKHTNLLLAVMALLLSGCGSDSDLSAPDGGSPGGGDPATPVVAAIEVESTVVMLWDTGLTTRLTVRALDSSGDSIPEVVFEWITADSSVATVSDGRVTARSDGWTQVGAAAGGHSATVSIVVVTPDGPRNRTDCIACHADDYVGKHGGSSTPETCLECHSGPTWIGGDFDHPAVANGFELLGAHASLSCTACHEADGTPKYPGVADDECIACHQSDYDAQHADSGYPTSCLTCHTRDAWTGADFDHDAQYFPIFTGRHSAQWGGCPTCHIDASDFTDFSCFACHPHEQQRMDDKHSEVSGYAYDSSLCYACHPRGEAD